jgi:sugar phosphate permease
MSSRLGAAAAPPLVMLIIAAAGWRTSFWIFGALGVVWGVSWWHWFRDDPSTHPAVSREELALITAGSQMTTQPRVHWRDLLDSNLICICLMYFCLGYGLYFYLTWLPTYFKEGRGFSTGQAAWLSSAVLLAEAVAAIAGGWLTDKLTVRYGLKVGRSIGAVNAHERNVHPARSVPQTARGGCHTAAAGCADESGERAMCHDIGGEAGTVTGP